MFGYILANMEQLSPEDRYRYQSYYCGLCRALGSRHNSLCRMTLTYDMTFLALFLSAVYDAPESRFSDIPAFSMDEHGIFDCGEIQGHHIQQT